MSSISLVYCVCTVFAVPGNSFSLYVYQFHVFFVFAVWSFDGSVVLNFTNILINFYVCLYVCAFFLRVLYLEFRYMHVCIERLCCTFSVIAEMQLQLYSRIVF